MTATVAWVAGQPVSEAEVDERERRVRAGTLASALPRPDTSEGRQLRRWLTQLLVAERVVAREPADADPPPLTDVLPDAAARLEIGSIAAAVLESDHARAVFARVTAAVTSTEDQVAAYHARNPTRFGPRRTAISLTQARPAITAHLTAAARRRTFRRWLDSRCADVVRLAPGYEHPGDPRQPDNTHRH
ncbi:MAG: malonyl CoA-ACP transacylase [Mycolicibacterium cosmeticum]|nr:malonyl CoA-ACP transacylase [Mycolicibacterium cosmeticum]